MSVFRGDTVFRQIGLAFLFTFTVLSVVAFAFACALIGCKYRLVLVVSLSPIDQNKSEK